MFSVQEFVLRYSGYSDAALLEVYNNTDGYSDEAHEAAVIVIEQRGGIAALEKNIADAAVIRKEEERIAKEVKEMGSQGVDVSFLKTVTSSTILPREKVQALIDDNYAAAAAALDNKKIKPRTVVGSVGGGVIASLVGGVLWGLQLIYSQRIFYLFGVGLVLLCYGIIRLCTGQTKENKFVLVTTIISAILSLLLGHFLYEMIGYRP